MIRVYCIALDTPERLDVKAFQHIRTGKEMLGGFHVFTAEEIETLDAGSLFKALDDVVAMAKPQAAPTAPDPAPAAAPPAKRAGELPLAGAQRWGEDDPDAWRSQVDFGA